MAKRDPRSPEQKIKQLELELEAKERELIAYRKEVGQINQKLEKFIQAMSGQLELASLIQKTLVPTEIPTIKGFGFSTKFVASSITGGDYFDIFEHEDKMRFGVLLANTSGHGMAALFLSVLLKLTTQIEARKGMDPDEVLKHMSKEIQTNLKGEDHANVFYGTIDRRHYKLKYSRSGVLQSYLYKYEQDKLVRLDETQPGIGRKSKGDFKFEEIGLDPRDKLILTSQGLVKALNPKDEEFGEGRLYEALLKDPRANPHEIRNELLFQLSQFVKGRDYPQDLSVLVMEVSDRVIKLRKG